MPTHRINNQINSPQLRVIDAQGNNLGILSLEKALELAKEQGLDLVEIAPTANPPVARIIEYGKILYQEAKEERKRRAKERKDVVKEMRFGLGTSEHDLNIKAAKTKEFLEQGFRVFVTIMLRGRQRNLPDMRERIDKKAGNFMALLPEAQIAQPLRRTPRGFSFALERKR